MSHPSTAARFTPNWRTAAAAAAALVFSGLAVAAPPAAPNDARARFEQDRAACLAGKTSEARDVCLHEARNAYADAKRGKLEVPNADYAANAVKRCEGLPALEEAACRARMAGAGKTEGSVEAGGIYRELTVQVPVDPQSGQPIGNVIGVPAPAPAPARPPTR